MNRSLAAVVLVVGCTSGGGVGPDDRVALVSIVAGEAFTCGLDEDGAAFCWGRQPVSSDLRFGSPEESPTAIPIPEPIASLHASGALGLDPLCAIGVSAQLYCSGSLLVYQDIGWLLGKPLTPIEADGPVAAVSVGNTHLCFLQDDQRIRCLGDPFAARRGVPGLDPIAVEPDETTVVSGGPWVGVVVGRWHGCGVAPDQQIHCWGTNGQGQLGNPTAPIDILHCGLDPSPCTENPTAVLGAAGVTDYAAGTAHTCVVLSTGEVLCWGADTFGQTGAVAPLDSCPGLFGQGMIACTRSPNKVPLGKQATRIAAGNDFACAIDNAGMVWCWGSNTAGQLGIGTVDSLRHPVPTQIEASVPFRSLALGRAHACGMSSDGSLYCWGSNSNGQLGIPGPGVVPTPTVAPEVRGAP